MSWSQDDMYAWILAHPGLRTREIADQKGDTIEAVRRRCRQLYRDGRVVREGTGAHNNPIRYYAILEARQ